MTYQKDSAELDRNSIKKDDKKNQKHGVAYVWGEERQMKAENMQDLL